VAGLPTVPAADNIAHLRTPLRIGFAVGCAAAAFGGVARAGGGDSIATAPEAPLGRELTGDRELGTSSVDYWRVTLARGDVLAVDFRKTSPDLPNTLFLGIFDPFVSDFGVGEDVPPAVERGTTTKTRATLRAPAAGRWTLAFYNGCFTCIEMPLRYAFVARVRRVTRVILNAPRHARSGEVLIFRGRVIGRDLAGARVVLQERRDRTWVTIARRQIGTQGSFSYARRVVFVAVYRLRALYPGDETHQPSSATTSVRAG
jgi:hypothetical protein